MSSQKKPTQYTLAPAKAKDLVKVGSRRSSRLRSRNSGEDPDPSDGTGSLTYSATSSVNSGGSATGESTDSSFDDVMRVLDLQDSGELKALMKKERVTSAGELRQRAQLASSGGSVASYGQSEDGESLLEGTKLLQTIAGQPSYEQEGDVLFAAAEPGSMKKKKRTIAPTRGRRLYDSPGSLDGDTPTKCPPLCSEKPPGTPPLRPRSFLDEVSEDDEDIWYAKWWMSCFPDAFKNLMPKR